MHTTVNQKYDEYGNTLIIIKELENGKFLVSVNYKSSYEYWPGDNLQIMNKIFDSPPLRVTESEIKEALLYLQTNSVGSNEVLSFIEEVSLKELKKLNKEQK